MTEILSLAILAIAAAIYLKVQSLYRKVVFEGVNMNIYPDIENDNFAATDQFISIVEQAIRKYKPLVIFEAGSGRTTAVIRQLQKELNIAKIISVDEDQHYAKQSGAKHCPVVNGWYDVSRLSLPKSICMLILDGPRDGKRFNIPFLPDIIVVDDAHREGRQMRRFAREKGYQVKTYNTPRGSAILIR